MSNIRIDNRTKNLNPKFIVPSHYKHKIPFILYEAIKRNQYKDLTEETYFYHNLPPERYRKIYKSRRHALNAMLIAILYHVNIISRQVPISATMLTEYCGLHTISLAGNKSITRGTRALSMLCDLGFITYRQCWDRVSKRYFPAAITITNRLMDLTGICPKKWNIELHNKLKNYNYKKSKKSTTSIDEYNYSNILRKEKLKKSYKYNFKKKSIENKSKVVIRSEKLVYINNKNKLQHFITCQVNDEFLNGFMPGVQLKDLKNIIDNRINFLNKIEKLLH